MNGGRVSLLVVNGLAVIMIDKCSAVLCHGASGVAVSRFLVVAQHYRLTVPSSGNPIFERAIR